MDETLFIKKHYIYFIVKKRLYGIQTPIFTISSSKAKNTFDHTAGNNTQGRNPWPIRSLGIHLSQRERELLWRQKKGKRDILP